MVFSGKASSRRKQIKTSLATRSAAQKDRISRAVVYVYMMLLMFKARGERLFQKDLVWCESVSSDGAPVAAGYFGREGLYVSDWWLRRDLHFGMAPARRADFP